MKEHRTNSQYRCIKGCFLSDAFFDGKPLSKEEYDFYVYVKYRSGDHFGLRVLPDQAVGFCRKAFEVGKHEDVRLRLTIRENDACSIYEFIVAGPSVLRADVNICKKGENPKKAEVRD